MRHLKAGNQFFHNHIPVELLHRKLRNRFYEVWRVGSFSQPTRKKTGRFASPTPSDVSTAGDFMSEPRKLYWHKVVAECETCSTSLTPLEIHYSADGEILITHLCLKCSKQIQCRYQHATLICSAFEADLEATFLTDYANESERL